MKGSGRGSLVNLTLFRGIQVDYVAWVCDQDAYACSGQKCSAQSMLFMHEVRSFQCLKIIYDFLFSETFKYMLID